MYNVPFRPVNAIIVAEAGNKYNISCVCVCSLSYPAQNAHVPYCHLWPVWLHNILPYYLINSTICERKLKEPKMCVLIFSKMFATFFILRRNEWDIIINAYLSSCKVPIIHYILMKLQFSQHIKKKNKSQISWKFIQWEPSCFMWMHGQTDMTKLIVTFHNFAKAPKRNMWYSCIHILYIRNVK